MSAFYECEIAKAKKRFNQSFGRIPTVNPSLRFAAIMVVIRMMKFTNEMHPKTAKNFSGTRNGSMSSVSGLKTIIGEGT